MRDPQFEQDTLATAQELCLRVHSSQSPAFAREVLGRLALGAETYGEDGYLDPDRDNIGEAAEEAPDVAGYLMLELQRLRPILLAEDWMDLRMEVLGAMATAARLDTEVRAIRRDRDEFLRDIPHHHPREGS
jgi:hypothetical protein